MPCWLVPQVQALPAGRSPSVLCIENQALPGWGVETGRPTAALAPSFRSGQKVEAGQGAETLGSHSKAGWVGARRRQGDGKNQAEPRRARRPGMRPPSAGHKGSLQPAMSKAPEKRC